MSWGIMTWPRFSWTTRGPAGCTSSSYCRASWDLALLFPAGPACCGKGTRRKGGKRENEKGSIISHFHVLVDYHRDRHLATSGAFVALATPTFQESLELVLGDGVGEDSFEFVSR